VRAYRGPRHRRNRANLRFAWYKPPSCGTDHPGGEFGEVAIGQFSLCNRVAATDELDVIDAWVK
jgi:hypothetical protein